MASGCCCCCCCWAARYDAASLAWRRDLSASVYGEKVFWSSLCSLMMRSNPYQASLMPSQWSPLASISSSACCLCGPARSALYARHLCIKEVQSTPHSSSIFVSDRSNQNINTSEIFHPSGWQTKTCLTNTGIQASTWWVELMCGTTCCLHHFASLTTSMFVVFSQRDSPFARAVIANWWPLTNIVLRSCLGVNDLAQNLTNPFRLISHSCLSDTTISSSPGIVPSFAQRAIAVVISGSPAMAYESRSPCVHNLKCLLTLLISIQKNSLTSFAALSSVKLSCVG